MLTNVRGRNQHFSQGHGIIGKEEDAKVVFGVWVIVGHASDVHDEANSLGDGQRLGCTMRGREYTSLAM